MLRVEAQKQLGDFSLDVAFSTEGRVTGLFGSSGAGKTSLVNIIAGLLQPDRGLVAIGDDARAEATRLLRELRLSGVSAQMDFEARGVRAQMKRADRLQARVAVIVGGDELARGEVTLRDMQTSEQRPVPRAGAVEAVRTILGSDPAQTGVRPGSDPGLTPV